MGQDMIFTCALVAILDFRQYNLQFVPQVHHHIMI